MSNHLGPGELASVPLANSRSESPFRSGRIHTCICNGDTYVLPLLPVCQMFSHKYRTAQGMSGPERFIDLHLTAKVLMTFFTREFLCGVDIFLFQFIFYRDKCFLFLFSWLILFWLDCFLLDLNRCANYFGFCQIYISWRWWWSRVRYLRCQWN